MANPYSKYTGQRVSAIPAGYLEANARAAASLQSGLASIGEAIGKYYGDKRKKEEEDKQAEQIRGINEIIMRSQRKPSKKPKKEAVVDTAPQEAVEVETPAQAEAAPVEPPLVSREDLKNYERRADDIASGRIFELAPENIPALPDGSGPVAPYGPAESPKIDWMPKTPEPLGPEIYPGAPPPPGIAAPARPTVTAEDISRFEGEERKKRVTANSMLAEWIKEYGADAKPDMLIMAGDMFNKHASAMREQKANKLQKKANKLLLESRKADIKKTEAETKKIEQEVEILGQPAQEWGKGSAIKVKLDDGTELPYAFVPTSKSGGVTVPFSNVPPADELSTDPSIAARYMEILKNELDSYNAIMAGPENVSTGMMRSEEEPGWWKNMPDSWKQSVDAKAQLIMATQKRLHEAGLLTELPSPLPSLLNPGKSLTPAPVAPEQRETQLKDREEKLNKLFPGSRPTQ
tara:strand:- start:5547 stop:6932 length:1386 start_codon:yes stop_codon:yes gene_type:complete